MDAECRELAANSRVDEGQHVNLEAAVWGGLESGGETQLQAFGYGSAFNECFQGRGRRLPVEQGDSLTLVEQLFAPRQERVVPVFIIMLVDYGMRWLSGEMNIGQVLRYVCRKLQIPQKHRRTGKRKWVIVVTGKLRPVHCKDERHYLQRSTTTVLWASVYGSRDRCPFAVNGHVI